MQEFSINKTLKQKINVTYSKTKRVSTDKKTRDEKHGFHTICITLPFQNHITFDYQS